jgi:putative transposase
MRPSRFTEEQIIGMLKEQEAGAKTVDVCRKHGISAATFYKFKAKFGGMEVSGARRRELDAIIRRRGRPDTIVSDNCTELTLMAVLRWCQQTGRRMALHRTGQAYPERLRRELQRALPGRMPE